MVEKSVKVINQVGLHARPASLVVNKAKSYKSSVEFIKNGKVYNAKSIVGVLCMAAMLNDEIVVRTCGDDEDIALAEVVELIESGFGEN